MTVDLLDRPGPPSLAATVLADPRARVVGAAAAFALLGLASSQDDDGLVLCPFRRCTGGYCPGCGMTRATGALLRGNVAASWQQHPFVVVALIQLLAVGGWSLAGGDRAAAPIHRLVPRLLTANAVALIAIWLVRLTAGSIPIPFA